MALRIGNVSLDKFKFENLYSTYLGMTPREQTIAMIAAVVVLILIIVLPVSVASGRITKLERDVAEGNRQLKEIIRAIDTYDRQRAQLTALQQQLSGGFDSAIATTVESVAEAGGIKDRIDSLKEKPMAPSEIFEEASVDVRMKKLSLKQLIDFLYAIEHQPDKVLRLKQLSIKTRFDNKQELDASFTVSTFRLLEAAGEGA